MLAGYKSCVSVKTPVPCLLLTVWGTGDQWPGQSSLGLWQFIAWRKTRSVILFAPVF